METKGETLIYAKEIAMNKVSSRKQNRRPTGLVFIVLLASAIGLFIIAAISSIVFTPTLSSKAMAAVADTAPSSVYDFKQQSTRLELHSWS